MTSARSSWSWIAVCALFLWGAPAPRAAPLPGQSESPSMDEVRAELNRLRSERSRLRESLTSSGGEKSKSITGYATVETSWRFGTGDRDLDT